MENKGTENKFRTKHINALYRILRLDYIISAVKTILDVSSTSMLAVIHAELFVP